MLENENDEKRARESENEFGQQRGGANARGPPTNRSSLEEASPAKWERSNVKTR
jgi:hypothetical protein